MLTRDQLAALDGSVAWLDAGPNATTGSSYLIIPASRERRLTANASSGIVRELDGAEQHTDIFTALRERWQPNRGAQQARFQGGWVGWFGYECASSTLNLQLVTESTEYPDAAWFLAGAWARFDHDSGTLTIDGSEPEAVARLENTLVGSPPESSVPERSAAESRDGSRAESRDAQPLDSARGPGRASWRDTPEHYVAQVRAAQALIAAGECYQLCFTSQVAGDAVIDPIESYFRLRAAAPSHHGSFIRIGDTALLSASPEQFLELSGARLRTKPIKGTRPRSAEPAADSRFAEELLASEKERAENLMIVDLMRNDLGRVAVTGSVRVPRLFDVESYAPVHQLVSTVEAELDPSLHPIDALIAAFPAGSMTGAPKHRAVTRLQALESGPRGIYSGAHGYLSNDGSIDLAMTIRSVVARPDGWVIGAGGGITTLSDPEAEVAEARLKAAALLAVLGVETAD